MIVKEIQIEMSDGRTYQYSDEDAVAIKKQIFDGIKPWIKDPVFDRYFSRAHIVEIHTRNLEVRL